MSEQAKKGGVPVLRFPEFWAARIEDDGFYKMFIIYGR